MLDITKDDQRDISVHRSPLQSTKTVRTSRAAADRFQQAFLDRIFGINIAGKTKSLSTSGTVGRFLLAFASVFETTLVFTELVYDTHKFVVKVQTMS